MRPLLLFVPVLMLVAADQVVATEIPPAASQAVARANTANPPSAAQAPFTSSLSSRTLQISRVQMATAVMDASSVDRLIRRASTSTPAERETVRATVAKAAVNPVFVNALAERAIALRSTDFSAALTAVALLGETRAPAAQPHLMRITAIPLPTEGHVVEGLIVERTTLEQLQMKAVQGLAYARSPAGDQSVIKLAASHPSLNVRSEAIESYLYNHQYSAEARATLQAAIQPADQIYLDRPHLLSTTVAADFNAQLARYLRLHPESVAPAPERAKPDAVALEREKAKDVKPTYSRTAISRAALLQVAAPPDRQ